MIVPSRIVLIGLCSMVAGSTQAQSPSPGANSKGAAVTQTAKGTFDVKLVPQTEADPSVGRMTIDKEWHGDLEGTSKGQMLAVMSEVKGSAGYVAMEKVTGRLRGKNGSFSLQHSGTMTRGAPQLVITVVPDSGTGELTGIAGKLTIDIADGKHFYGFEYTLPPAAN
jgi:hypothetical protein